MSFRKNSILLLGFLLAASGLYSKDIHVATTGNDANPGTEAEPFATLERAREAIRDWNKDGPLMESVEVVVHGGTYRRISSFALEAQDSGTATTPIVWRAAMGETVRLTGGVALPPEAFAPVSDEKVIDRLDVAARGNVVQIDLNAAGVKIEGNYPATFRGAPAVPELFFNDQRMTVARWPNEGWATVAEIVDEGSKAEGADSSSRGGIFKYSGDRPSRWNPVAGIWLQGYWCFDWYEETVQLGAIDPEQKQITLSKPTVYGVRQGNPSPRRFRALNLLEELDQPGEYYADFESGILYLWAPAPLDGAQIRLSTLKAPLVSLRDVSHVTLRGFIVEAGQHSGIVMTGGEGNRIEGCEVRNVRKHGIVVSGGKQHRAESCDIHHVGTGGLKLEGGNRRTLTPAGHEALNNHIWRFSEHQLAYASGIELLGVGNRAAYNLLHDAPHMAAGLVGNDHVFEYNVVRDVCTASDDSGALYKGRDPSARGNVIRYNFWRDIGSAMGHGTAAIYFDDGDCGETVFGNIFLRSGHPGKGAFGSIFSHGGYDIRAENNIFIDCERAFGSSPWKDENWKRLMAGADWQKRLWTDVDITQPPYITRYPEIADFTALRPAALRINHTRNNVVFGRGGIAAGNWVFRGDELWVTERDPGFVNAAEGDYRLRKDAEVFRRLRGFKAIPFEKIGLYESPLCTGRQPAARPIE